MREPLTRKDQVLALLRAGGRWGQSKDGRLLTLQDAKGRRVDAWQTAIKSAVKAFLQCAKAVKP